MRHFGFKAHDPVLGLCWLRRQPTRFLAGSAAGAIRLVDASRAVTAAATDDDDAAAAAADAAAAMDLPVVVDLPRFNNLTSVHVNADDSFVLASGYERHVTIFDLATGRVARKIENAAELHINISRFASNAPSIFATSSFDKRVSLWDLRASEAGGTRPVYSFASARGNVTLSFDPSDTLLLTAGVDNEIALHLVADGRLAMRLT